MLDGSFPRYHRTIMEAAPSKVDPKQVYLIISTAPDTGVAEAIAGALVESGLAACVNVVPGITSVFEWQGRVESDAECLVIAKASGTVVERCVARITELHPYELPEAIAVSVDAGLNAYLDWVRAQTPGG